MPAVMNSMSEPSIISMMRSRSSIAAWRPTSGSAPAPSPLVMLQPICRPTFTLECLSACASVLMQMKSTPSIPAEIMCATALPPPPPTPITLITAPWFSVSASTNIVSPLDVCETSHQSPSTRCGIGCAQRTQSMSQPFDTCRSDREARRTKNSLETMPSSGPTRLSPGRAARRGGRAGSSRGRTAAGRRRSNESDCSPRRRAR